MFALPGAAVLELIAASTIMGPTIFAGTILLPLSVRRQLRSQGRRDRYLSLSRFSLA
jgi:hypothetical protein